MPVAGFGPRCRAGLLLYNWMRNGFLDPLHPLWYSLRHNEAVPLTMQVAKQTYLARWIAEGVYLPLTLSLPDQSARHIPTRVS